MHEAYDLVHTHALECGKAGTAMDESRVRFHAHRVLTKSDHTHTQTRWVVEHSGTCAAAEVEQFIKLDLEQATSSDSVLSFYWNCTDFLDLPISLIFME